MFRSNQRPSRLIRRSMEVNSAREDEAPVLAHPRNVAGTVRKMVIEHDFTCSSATSEFHLAHIAHVDFFRICVEFVRDDRPKDECGGVVCGFYSTPGAQG